MKIAVGSDMNGGLVRAVIADLKKRGHQVDEYGAMVSERAPWPEVAVEVAGKVADGQYDQAVLFCWTGTGITIAANKVRGIRAALCGDAETARGARMWNDANILAMSLRATSEAVGLEILDAWFTAEPSGDADDVACLHFLREYEESR